jgi:hypothetical protein
VKNEVRNRPDSGVEIIDRRWQQVLAFGVLPASETLSMNPVAPPAMGATFEVMP